MIGCRDRGGKVGPHGKDARWLWESQMRVISRVLEGSHFHRIGCVDMQQQRMHTRTLCFAAHVLFCFVLPHRHFASSIDAVCPRGSNVCGALRVFHISYPLRRTTTLTFSFKHDTCRSIHYDEHSSSSSSLSLATWILTFLRLFLERYGKGHAYRKCVCTPLLASAQRVSLLRAKGIDDGYWNIQDASCSSLPT
jgi:hypothetical protein